MPMFSTEEKQAMIQFAEESGDILVGLGQWAYVACLHNDKPAVALCAAMPTADEQVMLTPLFLAVMPDADLRTCDGQPFHAPPVRSFNLALQPVVGHG